MLDAQFCPLSSGWRDSISNHLYPDEISTLLHYVEKYTEDVGIQPSQRIKYIEQNGWRTRMGGRGLQMAETEWSKKSTTTR